MVAWRRSARAAAERTAARVGPVSSGCAMVRADGLEGGGGHRGADVGRNVSLARDDAVELDPCGVDGREIAGLCACGQDRHGRGSAAAGRPPAGQRIEDHAADHGRSGRGRPPSTNRSPVAAASEASRRSTAAAPPGRSRESRLPDQRRPRPRRFQGGPGTAPGRRRGLRARRATGRTVHVGVVCEDNATAQAGCRVACQVERGAAATRNLLHRRAGPGPRGRGWRCPARCAGSPRGPATRRGARARDDGAAALDPKRAVDCEAHRPIGQRHLARIGHHTVAGDSTSPDRSSTIPSPVVPDTTTIGAPASAVDARRAATSAHTSPVRSPVTRSAFVTATSACSTFSASSPCSAHTSRAVVQQLRQRHRRHRA